MGKLNGESIAGAAFLFLSFVFLMAGLANAVFASIYPVDFMFTAFGGALVALGYRTYRSEKRRTESPDQVPAEQTSYLR